MRFYHEFRKSRVKERDHANSGAVTILVENTQIAEKGAVLARWETTDAGRYGRILNLVLEIKLPKQEKKDLVALMRQL